MSGVLWDLNEDLDALMERIQKRVGKKYRLTLVCRYTGGDLPDADILKSDDDFDLAIAAIQRLKDRQPVSRPHQSKVSPEK